MTGPTEAEESQPASLVIPGESDDVRTVALLTQIGSTDDPPRNFGGDLRPMGRVVPLASPEQWFALYKEIRNTRPERSNTTPWRRCLALMRHHKARSVIVEEHYVCLDYRSEYITFYAHVDKALPNYTRRLHFFSADIADTDLGRLTSEQRDSYLGFIVVRPSNLPIVGRAHIAVPEFVSISTAVRDTIHLFGQELSVYGVPFMEQESRMAQCGNVALWMIHHTAFLRQIFERRFIADFIDMPEGRWPMRVPAATGIVGPDAAKVLDSVGFHSEWKSAETHWLRRPLHWRDLAMSQRPQAEYVGQDDQENDRFERQTSVVEKILLDGSYIGKVRRDDQRALERYHLALMQEIVPHLESGFPTYLGSTDHAYVALGVDNLGRVVIHDDQYGPYLTADRLTTLSARELEEQTPRAGMSEEFETWWERSRRFGAVSIQSAADINRSAIEVIFAGPPRVFQLLGEARRVGLNRLNTALKPAFRHSAEADVTFGAPEGNAAPTMATAPDWTDSTVLVKGVTYKDMARERTMDPEDSLFVALSWVQLSEWVIVVELISLNPRWSANNQREPRRLSMAEVVYDSSSDPEHPRVLVIRVGNQAVFRRPDDTLYTAMTDAGVSIGAFVDVRAARSAETPAAADLFN